MHDKPYLGMFEIDYDDHKVCCSTEFLEGVFHSRSLKVSDRKMQLSIWDTVSGIFRFYSFYLAKRHLDIPYNRKRLTTE